MAVEWETQENIVELKSLLQILTLKIDAMDVKIEHIEQLAIDIKSKTLKPKMYEQGDVARW